jgi:hypothetical protein
MLAVVGPSVNQRNILNEQKCIKLSERHWSMWKRHPKNNPEKD